MSPVSGFRLGDQVMTPSGKLGTVVRVQRVKGREMVAVRMPPMMVTRRFSAGVLRLLAGRNEEEG